MGLFVLMATVSAPKVWNSLTLADSAIFPTYAIVTFCVVLQPNLGKRRSCTSRAYLGLLLRPCPAMPPPHHPQPSPPPPHGCSEAVTVSCCEELG